MARQRRHLPRAYGLVSLPGKGNACFAVDTNSAASYHNNMRKKFNCDRLVKERKNRNLGVGETRILLWMKGARLSRSTYYRLEKGTSNPTINNLSVIAKFFKKEILNNVTFKTTGAMISVELLLNIINRGY